MLTPIFIVAFTGNRPNDAPGRSLEELEAAKPRLHSVLEDLETRAAEVGGIVHLLSSAAEGADVVACEVAMERGIPVHIVLPFEEEFFKADFASEEAWQPSQQLIDQARRGKRGATLHIASSSDRRDDAFAEANHQILLVADVLISLTNGDRTLKPGGAAHFMEQASSIGIPTIAVNTMKLSETPVANGLDQFADGKNPEKGLSLIASLEKWASRVPDDQCPRSKNPCEELHLRLGLSSDYQKSKTKTGLQSAIWLHGIASIIAGLGVSYALAACPGYKILLLVLSILELGLIIAAEVIHKRHHNNHHTEAWLTSRYACELLRPAEIHITHGYPLLPPVVQHHPIWQRFHTSALLSCPRPAEKPDLKTQRRDYLENRIDDQIAYFTKHRDLSTPKAKLLNSKIKWLTIAAIATVTLAILYKLGNKLHFFDLHISWLELPLYLLPIALPLLAGIYSALRISTDVARRALRYDHMISLLQKSREKIVTAPSQRALSTAIMQTEQTLLEELNEFQLIQKVSLDH